MRALRGKMWQIIEPSLPIPSDQTSVSEMPPTWVCS
jgi:hypothetical protein